MKILRQSKSRVGPSWKPARILLVKGMAGYRVKRDIAKHPTDSGPDWVTVDESDLYSSESEARKTYLIWVLEQRVEDARLFRIGM